MLNGYLSEEPTEGVLFAQLSGFGEIRLDLAELRKWISFFNWTRWATFGQNWTTPSLIRGMTN
jgi:hypothetical protein